MRGSGKKRGVGSEFSGWFDKHRAAGSGARDKNRAPGEEEAGDNGVVFVDVSSCFPRAPTEPAVAVFISARLGHLRASAATLDGRCCRSKQSGVS